jgi:hypothetical protein
MPTFILAFVLLLSSAFAFEKTKINGKLFVAKGFDDNDLVEVTVVGTLPDTCHLNPFFEIERQGEAFLIRLFAYKAKLKEGCRQISTAYTETINFGRMARGQYTLKLVNKRETLEKKLTIKRSSSGLMDDFLYGNVTGIAEADAGREVELLGVNPVNCMVFTRLVAEVQDSLIVLKPQFREQGTCENKPTPFRIRYAVPFLQQADKGVLLHVRVMNGRSYNYLYQNKL